MIRLPALLAALFILISVAASAQNAPPIRLRGTIDSFDGRTLVVRSRDGAETSVTLAPGYTVGTVKKARLADIKTGDFIGSAAVKGADGKLHALEVHIFPEAMRGTGEGQRPWDSGPDSSMTNATVGQVAEISGGGRSLALAYNGGRAEIEVAPDVPIVALAPGAPPMLVKGRAVILFALKQPDGTLAAARVTVESDGVKPPM